MAGDVCFCAEEDPCRGQCSKEAGGWQKDQGAWEELIREMGSGMQESSEQEQVTVGWVGVTVHLDTISNVLTAGFLLRGATQVREVEWLVDTGVSTSLLSLRGWEQVNFF